MRLLVVADLHYSLRQFDWLLREGGRFDAVIIAGDLLDLASAVDLDAQIAVVLKYLSRLSASAPRVLVTSGNHDLDDATDSGERIAAWLPLARAAGALVDGDSTEVEGWRFTLCPWWDGDRTREDVARLLARDAMKPKKRWAWIHHAPPLGARVSWTGKTDAGDAVLTDWIREFQPDIVISGHIHQAPFKQGGSWVDRVGKTWVFNAGHYLSSTPPFFVLDLDTSSIEWFSEAGTGRANLDGSPHLEGVSVEEGP